MRYAHSDVIDTTRTINIIILFGKYIIIIFFSHFSFFVCMHVYDPLRHSIRIVHVPVLVERGGRNETKKQSETIGTRSIMNSGGCGAACISRTERKMYARGE